MLDISNTEYITIKKDGVFVGKQPAVYYRGKKVYSQNLVTTYFLYIQEKFPIIEEIHVLSSETEGNLYDINENPSPQHGEYMWCRVKFNNGKLGYWVSSLKWNSVTEAYCYCVSDVSFDTEFRKRLFLIQNENKR